MARAEFINSILSGKLGGSVFSRNKAGYYVRRWANPTNPQTLAQQQARANLAAVSSTWHSLSNPQKAAWNSFAITNFKAKFGNIPGVTYSGFNAFVSLINSIANARQNVMSLTWDAGVVVVEGDFSSVLTAPSLPLSAQIQDNTGAALQISLLDVSLDAATGISDCQFLFDRNMGGAGPTPPKPIFLDSISNTPVSLQITASLPGVQENQAIPNPDFMIIGQSPVIEDTTTWVAVASPSFNLTFSAANTGKFKNWFSAGETVEFRGYLVAQNGMTQPIGTVKKVIA